MQKYKINLELPDLFIALVVCVFVWLLVLAVVKISMSLYVFWPTIWATIKLYMLDCPPEHVFDRNMALVFGAIVITLYPTLILVASESNNKRRIIGDIRFWRIEEEEEDEDE